MSSWLLLKMMEDCDRLESQLKQIISQGKYSDSCSNEPEKLFREAKLFGKNTIIGSVVWVVYNEVGGTSGVVIGWMGGG